MVRSFLTNNLTNNLRSLLRHLGIAALVLVVLLPQRARSIEDSRGPVSMHTSDLESGRILLQRRKGAAPQADQAFLKSLERDTGQTWRRVRGRAGDIEVMQLQSGTLQTESLRKLRARADIEYAVIDQRRHRHALPNDSLYAGQWYLQNAQAAAIGAELAWDTTTGSTGTVVAVLDTGVRFDHPDLGRAAQAGKLLPGYDFIAADGNSGGSSFLTANDGDGRDGDPTDPGDWIDSNDQQQPFFSKCTIENSSWHGTRVSGLIGAATNNSIGIAGTTWLSWILPVRVLGKCGGYDSDILDAMRWSAGLPVSGVPINPYPAKIINLSLGNDGPCNNAYISVIQELTQLGVLVVASAGNSGGPVNAPANCPGVVAVAGVRHAGTKVGYSSLGPEIALAAPAGNCVNPSGACLFSLDTTYDTGRTTPSGGGYTDQFTVNLGTSFSAPLSAGVAALMHGVNAKLAMQHLRARLMEGARPFPTSSATDPAPPVCHVPTGANDLQSAECICTTNTCGAGMLYAPGAITAAQRPIASIAAPANIVAGSTLTLDGSNSSASCNRLLTAYSWTIVAAQGTAMPVIATPTQSAIQVTAPTSGSFTLRLTVTDNQGATDHGDSVVTDSSTTTTTIAPLAGPACPIAITVDQTPATPPAADLGGGGGGGDFGTELLLALLALGTYRRRPSSSWRKS